ncbi:MAG: hypothetical protein KIS87_12265 [Phycisphaeraceae bacterium]|nr:hypothetical protein [Phycisphaeraceae bacterium]
MPAGPPAPPPWRPTRLIRVVKSFDTSMGTTKAKTDASVGYLKALGNRQGPHALASEYLASSLAWWFGLSVPPFAILDLPADACFVLPRGVRTQPGPAFISRHVPGRTWQGSEAELRGLVNPTDVTRLMVFDTWVRNCDRHPPDLETRNPNYANVYLADTDNAAACRLMAIDHTHCFDAGRDFSERLSEIGKVKDERTYGLFPAFAPLIDPGELQWCKSLLRSVTREQVEEIVARIPREWEVDARAGAALVGLVHARAGFVADRIDSGWPTGTAAGNL